MEAGKVAIIILNYNSWEETIKEADCCNRNLNIEYKDIVVVDNGSPNNSFEMLEKDSKSKGYILLKSTENNGYASGNNIGMRYAYHNGYKYAWILNNDILITDKQIVDKMMSVFNKDNTIAVVNPDIYAADGYMYNRDAKRPSFFDYTLGGYMYKKRGREVKDLGGYAFIYRPQGCCMMVDLNKMTEIDYMDERTFLYVEEPILAERLLKYDYRCVCCLTTSIVHNHSTTVKSVLDKNKIIKINNESFRYYLEKYRGFNKLQVAVCCFFNVLKGLILG